MKMSKVVKAVAPEKRTLNEVRRAARKQGKSSLSMREIDKEIRAYRRERKRKQIGNFFAAGCVIDQPSISQPAF